jgi:hypothetical protein
MPKVQSGIYENVYIENQEYLEPELATGDKVTQVTFKNSQSLQEVNSQTNPSVGHHYSTTNHTRHSSRCHDRIGTAEPIPKRQTLRSLVKLYEGQGVDRQTGHNHTKSRRGVKIGAGSQTNHVHSQSPIDQRDTYIPTPNLKSTNAL